MLSWTPFSLAALPSTSLLPSPLSPISTSFLSSSPWAFPTTTSTDQKIYHNNLHYIFINNLITLSLLFASGVKQGCPLSMTLFALALDPIIRLMASHISPHNGIVCGYCDDLCVATQNLIDTLRHTTGIFTIIQHACNLLLNPHKTQILCLTQQGKQRLLHHIHKHLPQLRDATFTDAIIYLGMLIGPGAHTKQFLKPLSKFHTSVSHVRSLGLGLTPSISLYNQISFPILAWKASFVQPDHDTLLQEAKSLQLLTNSPYNATPNNLIYNLKQLGLPTQAHSLRTTSIAFRTRNALHTMHNYHDNITLLLQHYTHDNRVLQPPLQHWIDNSITMSLYNAVQHTQSLLTQITDHHPQKQLTQLLLPLTHQIDLPQLLTKRWARFFTTTDLQPAIYHAMQNLHQITTTCKPCTTMSIIKTWLYAWTTNNRFGNYNQPCPLCNAPNNDTRRHFYNCPSLTSAAKQILNQQYLPTTRHYFFLATPYSTMQCNATPLLTLNAIHIHCITKTYHSIKHSPHNDITDTYHANLKQLLQHDPKLLNVYLLAQTTQLYDEHSQPQIHPIFHGN